MKFSAKLVSMGVKKVEVFTENGSKIEIRKNCWIERPT